MPCMEETSRAEDALTQATHASAEASAGEASDNENRPVYEVGFHVVPQVGDDGVAAVVEKIRKAIGDGAEFISEGFPKKMRLAYVIERSEQGKREKFSDSYFGWIKFALALEEANKEAVSSLDGKFRGMKDILRFIMIKTTRADAGAAPRRAIFTSDRLEGATIEAPKRESEQAGEVSEEELDKSIEALVK